MNYLKTSILAASLGFCVLSTGCATVTGGTSEKVSVKTQKQSQEIAGANCVLTNSGGTYNVVTPGTVSVRRAKDDLTVQCSKDGEVTANLTVPSSYRKGAIAGNIALLGVLSVVTYGIDRASGSIFAYPDNLTVSFGENAGTSQPASAQPDSAAQVQTSSTDTSKTQ